MPRRAPSRYAEKTIYPVDRHRYRLFREGVSTAEIATRDRVTISQVERSILKCREERQAYSQEAVEIAVRRTVLEKLPEAAQAISGALQATRKQTIAVVIEGEQMEETIDVPDHRTQLEGNAALIAMLASIKVPVPLSQVNVDNRSQTNNVLGLPAPTGQPSSAEAVIREIRAARGLALTDGATVDVGGNAPAMIETDVELADELAESDEEDLDEEDEPEEAEEE